MPDNARMNPSPTSLLRRHWLWGVGAAAAAAGAGVAWWRRVFWHAVVGSLVLLAGLVLQGHDGRMATYAALVLVAASLEWLLHRGWRG